MEWWREFPLAHFLYAISIWTLVLDKDKTKREDEID